MRLCTAESWQDALVHGIRERGGIRAKKGGQMKIPVPTRSWGRISLVAAVVITTAIVFAFPSLATPAPTPIAQTQFESADGNLTLDGLNNVAGAAFTEDWCSQTLANLDAQTPASKTDVCQSGDFAPNLTVADDKPSGSSDDSLGQGSKEDDTNPTVVSGSIPPNKSDLSRFMTSHEKHQVNIGSIESPTLRNDTFLYLAWERTNVLGSANMDFEVNQLRCEPGNAQLTPPQPTNCAANGVTPVRSPGDVLVRFDFTNGGGNPVLSLDKWITTGNASQCLANNALPCWGVNTTDDNLDGVIDQQIDLTAAGFANGQVFNPPPPPNKKTPPTTTLEPIPPNAPRQLLGLTFGEAGVDLTAAGVFPVNQCFNLGSAFLKSRSSASFPAELKDFIAPAPLNITNCGDVSILKTDGAATPNPVSGATFTLYNDPGLGVNADFTYTDGAGGTTGVYDPGVDTVTLASTGRTCTTNALGQCVENATGATYPPSFSNVPFGSYCVAETTVPAGFSGPDNFSCFNLSDANSSFTHTFVDPPLFKVITVVCRLGTTPALYASKVSYDGAALPGSNNTPTTMPTGIDAAKLCGLTGTYTHSDAGVPKGAHSSSISIP